MSKGGSTTSVEIPAWLEEAAIKNLAKADKISALGSIPLSYGPTVAAFTPMQNSSFLNTANTASAFGLAAPTGNDIYGGMDAPTDYGGGIMAYSAKPLFDKTMEEFRLDRPGQADYIDSFFIDPYTGQPGINVNLTSPVSNYMSPVSNSRVSSGSSGSSRDDGLDRILTIDRTNYAEGVSDGALGFGENKNGDVIAIGYNPGQVDPALADAAGYTRRDDNPFDYSFSDHIEAMTNDLKSMPGKIKDDFFQLNNTSTKY